MTTVPTTTAGPAGDAQPSEPLRANPLQATEVTVHNVVLHNASPVRLKVQWLRGNMFPTRPGIDPSFDVPDSFRLQIDEALISVSLADLSNLLRQDTFRHSPLKNLHISLAEDRLKITGTLHRLVPLPVQLLASFTVAPNHHYVRLHADKISVLKIPLKRILHTLHLRLTDLVSVPDKPGIAINGDDIDVDVNRLLPPPQAEGVLTQVQIAHNGDLVETYGRPHDQSARVGHWRNFIRMRGGTLGFGKLLMHNADLLLVDSADRDWLNFNLAHYQEQLVYGTTRITRQGGLQIFIPDFDKLPPDAQKGQIMREWIHGRNIDPPLATR